MVISGNKMVQIKQNKTKVIFSCSEDEFFEYWFTYLNLTKDYADYMFRSDKTDKYLKQCFSSSLGTRFIKQALWETILESILIDGVDDTYSQRRIVKTFCKVLGIGKKNSVDSCRIIWHSTPYPEEIVQKWDKLEENGEEKLFRQNPHYKKAYEVALSIYSDEIILSDLIKSENIRNSAHTLKEEFGLSELTEKRLDFYAFRNHDVFPIDETLDDALWDNYEVPADEVYDDILLRYKGYRGILLQIMKADTMVYEERRKEKFKWG